MGGGGAHSSTGTQRQTLVLRLRHLWNFQLLRLQDLFVLHRRHLASSVCCARSGLWLFSEPALFRNSEIGNVCRVCATRVPMLEASMLRYLSSPELIPVTYGRPELHTLLQSSSLGWTFGRRATNEYLHIERLCTPH